MASTQAGSGGSDPRSHFRAMFDAAKAAHSKLDSESADERPLDDDVDEDEGEESEETEETDQEESPEETEEETDEDDEAEESEEGEETEESEEADEEEGEEEETPKLLSDAEIKKIQRQFPNDPEKQIKAFQAAFTKKTQGLAAERKKLAKYEPYAALIDLFDTDTETGMKALAKHFGYEITKGGKVKPDDDAEEPAAGEEFEFQGKQREAALTAIREALGPELEYQAEAQLNVFEKVFGKQLLSMVNAAVKPLRETTNRVVTKDADRETTRIMSAFTRKHPDWQEHEDAMMALAQRLDPKGMTEAEYIELLYNAVTRDSQEATREEDIRREAVRRTKKKLKKLGTVTPGEDRRRSATPEGQVRRVARRDISFSEAARLAKQGIRLEDEDDD